jgi:hypothetical protein
MTPTTLLPPAARLFDDQRARDDAMARARLQRAQGAFQKWPAGFCGFEAALTCETDTGVAMESVCVGVGRCPEVDAMADGVRPGVALALEAGDHATRELLEHIVEDEEHHVDWLEAQTHKIDEVGYQSYLAQQVYERS